jgi:hypothetical protein
MRGGVSVPGLVRGGVSVPGSPPRGRVGTPPEAPAEPQSAPRRRPGPKPHSHNYSTDEKTIQDNRLARELAESGLKWTAIGKRLGVSRWRARAWAIQGGYQPPPRPPGRSNQRGA